MDLLLVWRQKASYDVLRRAARTASLEGHIDDFVTVQRASVPAAMLGDKDTAAITYRQTGSMTEEHAQRRNVRAQGVVRRYRRRNTTVEENNLQFQVSTLRKALGEDRDLIRTVSGRGYRFVAEVTTESRSSHPVLENAALDERDEAARQMREPPDLEKFAAETAANRLVTLTGTEGIGKVRLAFELARRAVPTFANDIGVAECGRVLDPKRIPATAGSSPGLDSAATALERAAASLNPQHLLLLLDSCERIIETVTSVAEVLLQANAKL